MKCIKCLEDQEDSNFPVRDNRIIPLCTLCYSQTSKIQIERRNNSVNGTKPDLLQKYLEHTEELEPEEIYHIWCFISIVSSVLCGRCWTTLGGLPVSSNFFIVLTGPPGIPRKTTAIRAARDIAEQLKEKGFLSEASESITQARLVDELERGQQVVTIKNSKGEDKDHSFMSLLAVASEISNFIKPKDTDLSTFLLSLFDGESKFTHATRHKGVASLKNVTLNILAGTTTTFFEGLTFMEHVKSGLSSRCIFLHCDGRRFNYPDPYIDLALKESIQEDLLLLTEIKGMIPFSPEAKKTYTEWYSNQPIVAVEGTPKNMLTYCARRQTYVRKLALVLWALEYIREDLKGKKEINQRNVTEAINLMTLTEEYMVAAYGKSGGSPDVGAINDVLTFFQGHLGEWISRQQLVYRFAKEIKPETLDYILQSLVEEIGALKAQRIAGRLRYKFVGLKTIEEQISKEYTEVNKKGKEDEV